MKISSSALLVALPAVAVTLTACDQSTSSAPGTSSKPAASTTAAPGSTAAGTTAPKPVPPSPTRPPMPTAPSPADVDCGPITGSNGQSANVIAYGRQVGIAGCTEAVTVAHDYVNASRTDDAVQVDNWTCEPQPDTDVPHICFKDGLLLGLRGGASYLLLPPPPPTATTPH
ncbi:hypothetical protein [Nocardia sp. NPDC020380]|uniref:hypothetical protein n=1 Tax=Nocardia sp. NPDC020380 TaxID=3364309 RepID=UPI0037A11555